MGTTVDPVMGEVAERAWGTGREELVGHCCEPLDVRLENMTTASLDRHWFTFAGGEVRRLVAKTLRPIELAPQWSLIPPAMHDQVRRNLDHRLEPRLYGVLRSIGLPRPLRVPTPAVVDERDDRITLWLEDVADTTEWDAGRYRRTAGALGAMGASVGADEARALGLTTRDYGELYFGKVVQHDFPLLAAPGLWADPAVSEAGGDRLRAGLEWLRSEVEARIPGMARSGEALHHGDATPANFLEPGDGTIVGIDWSYAGLAPAGSDLAQLFAGRFDSGHARPEDVPDLIDLLVDSYLDGARTMGVEISRDEVQENFLVVWAARSAFSALVPERADLSEEQRHDLVVTRGKATLAAIEVARRLWSPRR